MVWSTREVLNNFNDIENKYTLTVSLIKMYLHFPLIGDFTPSGYVPFIREPLGVKSPITDSFYILFEIGSVL